MRSGDFIVEPGPTVPRTKAGVTWTPWPRQVTNAGDRAPCPDDVESTERGDDKRSAAIVEEATERARTVLAEAHDLAARQAAEVLEAARVEALRIVTEARERASEVFAQASAQGYQEGSERAARELESRLNELLDLFEGVRRAEAEYLKEREPQIVSLALEISSKILEREVASDPEVILSIADRALALAGASTDYCILLNPADMDVFEGHLERTGRKTTVQVVGDPTIGRGGCVITTAHGKVDARLEAQLANIESALLGAEVER